MARGSNKGWHKVGDYSSRAGAEKRASKCSHLQTKITERWCKVRTTPSGRRRIHPIDYPGGKRKKVYRLWVK